MPAGDQQDMGLKLTLEKPGVQYSVEYHRNGTLSLSRNQVLPITFDVEGKSENGIASAEDFLAFAAAVNAGASTAEWENAEGWVNLLNDIDFEGVTGFVPVGFATAPWNYGFAGQPIGVEEHPVPDMPFAEDCPPITITIPMARIPWAIHEKSLAIAAPQPSSLTPEGPAEQKTLIPFGSTMLRMTEMPIVKAD